MFSHEQALKKLSNLHVFFERFKSQKRCVVHKPKINSHFSIFQRFLLKADMKTFPKCRDSVVRDILSKHCDAREGGFVPLTGHPTGSNSRYANDRAL